MDLITPNSRKRPENQAVKLGWILPQLQHVRLYSVLFGFHGKNSQLMGEKFQPTHCNFLGGQEVIPLLLITIV